MNKKQEVYSANELKGNSVVSISNGEMIANVEDILIDPKELKASAVVTSSGGLLSREVKAIDSGNVQVWGQDVILVSNSDVIMEKLELPNFDAWLSVAENLIDREVVSEDGKRIGSLQDVLIDTEGNLVSYQLDQIGYALDEVLVEGEGPEPNRIPSRATRSLGQDVLVINTKAAD